MRILVFLLLLGSVCLAKPLVLRGAKIHTVTAGVIEKGTLVVIDGKIVSVGPQVTFLWQGEVISVDR